MKMSDLMDKLTRLTAELRDYARPKGYQGMTNADAMKVEPLYQLASEAVGLAKRQEQRLKRLQAQKDAMQRRAEAAEADWQAAERRLREAHRDLWQISRKIAGGQY